MNPAELIQGSPEWIAARLGKCTASRIADMLAKTKSGWGASRANYCAELVAERLTGATAEHYVSREMQWGTDTEEEARTAYEFFRDATIEKVGFIPHPESPVTGASPDGFVGDDGMIELKCPNTSTHIEWLLGRSVPGKYALQMQWQMACAGRKWCDFVSYDPRMPERMKLFVARAKADPAKALEIKREVATFLGEVEAKVNALLAQYGGTQAIAA